MTRRFMPANKERAARYWQEHANYAPTQAAIAGAASIATRELAERRARTPLKPQAEQRPCDIGLFSDEAAQLDLIDLTRRDGRGTTRGE